MIAAGTCACDGGEIGISYPSCGAVEDVVTVDVKVRGCPPTPMDLLKGLLGAFAGHRRSDEAGLRAAGHPLRV